jgi:hypothetical protein
MAMKTAITFSILFKDFFIFFYLGLVVSPIAAINCEIPVAIPQMAL